MRIAVLGGGNGSLAAAGDLALAGHEVALWRRARADIETYRRERLKALVGMLGFMGLTRPPVTGE